MNKIQKRETAAIAYCILNNDSSDIVKMMVKKEIIALMNTFEENAVDTTLRYHDHLKDGFRT
ncbi:hypothetical protein DID80_01395 [Candidatus Marinamargulisbacteria bacterium SCGC AAA071-K20]|nr:hypothetical protein DID80_01395 [Candidatus Marinamargulisbacteria bacterium SCGC AAA071-K20]